MKIFSFLFLFLVSSSLADYHYFAKIDEHGIDTREEILLHKKFITQGIDHWRQDLNKSDKMVKSMSEDGFFKYTYHPIHTNTRTSINSLISELEKPLSPQSYKAVQKCILELAKINREHPKVFYQAIKDINEQNINTFRLNGQYTDTRLITPYYFSLNYIRPFLQAQWKTSLEKGAVSKELVETDILFALIWGRYLKKQKQYGYDRILNGLRFHPETVLQTIKNPNFSKEFDLGFCWKVTQSLSYYDHIEIVSSLNSDIDHIKPLLPKLHQQFQTLFKPIYESNENGKKISVYIINRHFIPEAHDIHLPEEPDEPKTIDGLPFFPSEVVIPRKISAINKVFIGNQEYDFPEHYELHIESLKFTPAKDRKSLKITFGGADGAAGYDAEIYIGNTDKKNAHYMY